VISARKRKVKPAFKVWLEDEIGSYVFGEGPFKLLQKVKELGTLSGAAEALGMSYRHAWGVIKEVEKLVGEPLLETRKGGRAGGGGARLTEAGGRFLKDFSRVRETFSKASLDEFGWEDLFVKFSARNRIEGEVVSVEKDRVSAVVKIKVDVPCIVAAFITREAVEELGVKKGDRAAAVIKATEVMVSK
jgi:molybdate transport system regulatory protein